MKTVLLPLSCIFLYIVDMLLTYWAIEKNKGNYEEENLVLSKFFIRFGVFKTIMTTLLLYCTLVFMITYLFPSLDVILFIFFVMGIFNLINNLIVIRRVKNRKIIQER